jgi:hypothetical protein
MAIKYTKIFHSKAFKSIPKLEFSVQKYTIWQPCGLLQNVFSAKLLRVASPGGVAQWISQPPEKQKTRVRLPPGYIKGFLGKSWQWCCEY